MPYSAASTIRAGAFRRRSATPMAQSRARDRSVMSDTRSLSLTRHIPAWRSQRMSPAPVDCDYVHYLSMTDSARAASLDVATAAYMAAVLKYPKRNLGLRHGIRIIKRHDGEPRPEPPRDPNLRSWAAHLIGGSKMQLLGLSRPSTRRGQSTWPRRCSGSTARAGSGSR